MAKPEVTKIGFEGIQVCVPHEFTDEQVIEFAQEQTPSMLIPYSIRRADHPDSRGDPERAQCSEHFENCHIVLIFDIESCPITTRLHS